MKKLVNVFLGAALLVAACVFAFNGESTVGKSVDDSLAASIRGGGSCDNKFNWDNENPVYCRGGDCVTQKPNTMSSGDGGTSGFTNQTCGAAVGCGWFSNSADCAKPTTAISTGIVLEN